MHWRSVAAWAFAAIGFASADTTSSVYQDPLTGFTFSQYSALYNINGGAITYRVALPTDVSSGQPYDVVVQVVAPNDVGWAGLAWNGGMTGNPLTVSWKNGNSATVSSRWASSHSMPTEYSGATYEVLQTGTSANNTHWQFTAKCTGCTSWNGQTLSPTGSHRLAMAYSANGPSNPASPSSSFPVHSVHTYWEHNFGQAGNPTFNQLVVQNGGMASRAGSLVTVTDFGDVWPAALRFYLEAKIGGGVERHSIKWADMAALLNEIGFVDVKVEKTVKTELGSGVDDVPVSDMRWAERDNDIKIFNWLRLFT